MAECAYADWDDHVGTLRAPLDEAQRRRKTLVLKSPGVSASVSATVSFSLSAESVEELVHSLLDGVRETVALRRLAG